MHNRRDQVQAHTFMVGRLVSALLRGEPDLANPPLRRTWVGLISGIILATLVIAGFVVLAAIKPGGATGWRKPGTLVVDKQTGTGFVLLDGRLRPVTNYASARLLLGASLTVDAVTSSSIAGVPRGGQIGIIDAPQSLPLRTSSTRPWTVCAASTPITTSPQGVQPAVLLTIGNAIAARPLSDHQAVLVRTPEGTTYLATTRERMRVTQPWVTRALGFNDGSAIAVQDSWVDALPAGPDLPQPAPSGLGKPGPTLDGQTTRVGEIFIVHSPGSVDRVYLLTSSGLQPLTQTAAALALGSPATSAAYGSKTVTAHQLSSSALAVAKILPVPAWQALVPPTPPTLDAVTSGRMPCVRVIPTGVQVNISVVIAPAATVRGVGTLQPTSAGIGTNNVSAVRSPSPVVIARAAQTAGRPNSSTPSESGNKAPSGISSQTRTADEVDLAPGAGLLARTLPATGVPGAGLYLVTEDGAKYPIASAQAATALGYSVAAATAVPANLLALLPTGPVLNILGSGGGTAAS